MQIILNGEPTTVKNKISIHDLLVHLSRDPGQKGIAVAVNAEIITRTEWSSTGLNPEDRVDIINAVQGG